MNEIGVTKKRWFILGGVYYLSNIEFRKIDGYRPGPRYLVAEIACRSIPSHEKNHDFGDKNPRDIPKTKNHEKILYVKNFHKFLWLPKISGIKIPKLRKISNPGDKNLETQKNPTSRRCAKRKNPEKIPIVRKP